MATLQPAPNGSTEDDTARIQAALDAAGAAPLSPATGFRGAVVLSEGTFRIATGLLLQHDGVVLRGAGVGQTVLLATAATQYTMLTVRGRSRPGISNTESLLKSRVVFGRSVLCCRHSAWCMVLDAARSPYLAGLASHR